MPALIASWRCWSMSAVKIGVSASRPITTPAWRAEIVQPPWIACGARPPSAVSVSAERTSARPIPTRICGGIVSAIVAFGRKARPARPPETRIAPAAARARALGHELGRARLPSDRRQRHHRDDERRADRAQAPAFDQQQDEQEERRGDRRRDHRQGEVRPEVRAAGAAQLGSIDPGRRLVPGDGEDRHRGDQRHRHLEEEDRLPGDELGEEAADRRAERRAGRPGGGPDRRRPPLGADRRRQQLQRRGHRGGAAERLHAAGERSGSRARSARPQARPAPAKIARPTAAARPGPTRRASSAAGTAASAITRLKETSTQVTPATLVSSSR